MSKHSHHLSQRDILEAINLLLRKRGEIPDKYVYFKYKFGIVGDPIITLVGEPPIGAGDVYLDWDFESADNVINIRDGVKR